jgi:hypothetical protein
MAEQLIKKNINTIDIRTLGMKLINSSLIKIPTLTFTWLKIKAQNGI